MARSSEAEEELSVLRSAYGDNLTGTHLSLDPLTPLFHHATHISSISLCYTYWLLSDLPRFHWKE